MSGDTPLSYWDYLRLDALLDLQGGREDESRLMPDELHFIVVHQVFELWFKLILSELRLARDHLAAPRIPEERVPYVVHHLRRVNEIFRLAIDQFRVMETLTPQDFLAFRDKLVPASGFQSFQLREIEIVLGLTVEERQKGGQPDPLEPLSRAAAASPTGRRLWSRLEEARRAVDLRSALHEWLHRTPIHGSTPDEPDDDRIVTRFIDGYLACLDGLRQEHLDQFRHVLVENLSELELRLSRSVEDARAFLEARDVPADGRQRARRIRAGLLFIESYRDLPLLAWPRSLVDTVVELEELLVLWRHRHARMVERIIGRRVGTGGSEGVAYLDRTTAYRVFPELWAVRALLVPRESLPVLQDRDRYGFAR